MNVADVLPLDESEFLPAICNPSSLPLIEGDELITILEKAAESELDGLVRCLVGKGGITCQLARLPIYKESQPHHRVYARDIAAEIQKYGGNTLTSQLFRKGKGVRYEEIVRDVAKKLGIQPLQIVGQTEIKIQEHLLDSLWRSMDSGQRAALLKEFRVCDKSLIAQSTLPAVLIKATTLTGSVLTRQA